MDGANGFSDGEFSRRMSLARIGIRMHHTYMYQSVGEILSALTVRYSITTDHIKCFYLFLRLYFSPRRDQFDYRFGSSRELVKLLAKECRAINKRENNLPSGEALPVSGLHHWGKREIFLSASTGQKSDSDKGLQRLEKDLRDADLLTKLERKYEIANYPWMFETSKRRAQKAGGAVVILPQKARSQLSIQPKGEHASFMLNGIRILPSKKFSPLQEIPPYDWESRGWPADKDYTEEQEAVFNEQHPAYPGEPISQGHSLYEIKHVLDWLFCTEHRTQTLQDINKEAIEIARDDILTTKKLQLACTNYARLLGILNEYNYQDVLYLTLPQGNETIDEFMKSIKRMDENKKHELFTSDEEAWRTFRKQRDALETLMTRSQKEEKTK